MTESPFTIIHRVLDEMQTTDTLPPGAPGAIYAAVDQLRSDHAPTEHLAIAGEVSTTILKLQWAAVSHRDQLAGLRERLQELKSDLPPEASAGRWAA